MSVIDAKYTELSGSDGFLGQPTSSEADTPDAKGRYRHFQSGSIYWTPDTGPHEVHGGIRDKWAGFGWEGSLLGYPLTDEMATPDGIGRYNHFQGGSIYWTPDTGPHEVHGDIRDKWASLGWERSFLGYPLTDETATPDGFGRYNHFQGGSIYWALNTGAHEVHGDIRNKWASLGWEQSFLGYPLTDETAMADGIERYNQFQGGSIVWTPDTGAREIAGTSRTVILYADTKFKGKRVFASEGNYDADVLLEPFRYWEGSALGGTWKVSGLSSLQVTPGMELQLFTQSGWRGNTTTITSDTSDLGRQWNDKVTCIIVRDLTNRSPKVTLWQNDNYNGSFVLLSAGLHDIQELQLMNDRTSAVEVPRGVIVILYQNDRFSGRLMGFDRSTPRLSDYIGDRTSSVIVEAEADYEKLLRKNEVHAGAIGQPPRMEGFQLTDVETKPLLVGELLLPFFYVTDIEHPAEVQARRSPYYIFSREQFWRRHDFREHAAGTKETVGLRYKEGASVDTLRSIKTTLKWEITGGGKFKITDAISAELGAKIERVTETTTTTTEKEYMEIEKTEQIEFSADAPRMLVSVWGMIDRFSVRRISGDVIGAWEVALPGVIRDAYPR